MPLPDSPHSPSPKIGVFDSGVGGLSVLRALWQTVPEAAFLYVADQVHVPYGRRPLEEVRSFAEGISRFLVEQGCDLIVVACNTASAAALHYLRERFPNLRFVGMEPAVKPAAENTQSGVVGVLATPATFQGALYASVVERFAKHVRLLPHTCPGLVEQIEAGHLEHPQTRRILEEALTPMLAGGIDTVVLGCTHYPFVIPLIKEIVGSQVRVIDPAPAVARQARRQLLALGLLVTEQPMFPDSRPWENTRFYTSGNVAQFQRMIGHLIGINATPAALHWEEGELKMIEYSN